MNVLNVGGCNKHIAIPGHFEGWDHVLLDIEKNPEVDVVCDARNMRTMPAGQYDAVYSSHFLEHLYRHDVGSAIEGFKHVMKDDGFVQIVVPNIGALINHLAETGKDIEDVLYDSPAGPIRGIDMLYGLESFIRDSGNDFMCHKNAFTPQSMGRLLFEHGFSHVFIGSGDFNVIAFAFKCEPTAQQMIDLKLNPAPQKVAAAA